MPPGEKAPNPESAATIADVANTWEQFDRARPELCAQLLIDALPESQEQAHAWYGTATPSPYLNALTDRLARFGYLTGEKPGPAAIEAAVRRFQADAGLTADGWAGNETWDALQELFAFSTPFHAKRWYSAAGEPLAILPRAILLRLTAYGLANEEETPRGAEPAGLPVAWRRWCEVAPTLGFAAADFADARLTPARVDQLFAHDALVTHCAKFLAARATTDVLAIAAVPSTARFLTALAKVELWLQGYKVQLDGRAEPLVEMKLRRGPGKGAPHSFQPELTAFGDALSDFFRATDDCGSRTPSPAFHDPRHLSPSITSAILLATLERFACLHTRGELLAADDDDAETSRAVDDYLATMARTPDDPFWSDLVKEVREKANSFFDGVRRLWRRFVEWIRAGLTRIRNIARVVWTKLGEILRTIRVASDAFVEGIQYLVRTDLPGSSASGMIVSHRGDFDFRVFLGDHTPDATYEETLAALRRKPLALRIAGQILGLVIASVGTITAGLASAWILLVARLLPLWQQLAALVRELAAYRPLRNA